MERAIARRQRINYLKRTIASAQVDSSIDAPDIVAEGCAVTLRYAGDEETERFWVGDVDTRGEDISVITPSSPMGQALLGSARGDTVTYKAPAGELAVEVVGIG
jgi:transcription elongation factor GreA